MTMTIDNKLIVPSYIAAEQREQELKKQAEAAASEKAENARKAKMLPEPCGYHLLCQVPEVDKKHGELIVKADSTVRVEEHTTVS